MMTNNHNFIINELANLNPPQNEFNNKLIKKALAIIGNPQDSYRVIHIAGSNGKGSTAAFLEAGLIAANYKVGKYTSPYIHTINECICLNQQMISTDHLSKLYLANKIILEQNNIFLSSFEMLTLIMFAYFKEQQIDFLILETGLGGLNDATNVVKSEFSIVTNISLEHTQWLGNSLRDIAKHKAGIINGGITIIADNSPELAQEVSKKSPDYINIRDKYSISSKLNHYNFTTILKFNNKNSNQTHYIELGLFGHFQAFNFLCAYEIFLALKIDYNLIQAAMLRTRWHGRIERLSRYPYVIADASHNPDGCVNLRKSLSGFFPAKNSIIICSILADKNQVAMLNEYSQISENIIFCGIPNQPRAVNPYHLAAKARGKFKNIYVIMSPESALRAAKILKPVILISGSTYLLKNFLGIPKLIENHEFSVF